MLWDKTAEEEKDLARTRARRKGLPFKESFDNQIEDDEDDFVCKCGGERFRREKDGSLTCVDCKRNTMPVDENSEGVVYEAREHVSPVEVGQTWEDLTLELGPPDIEQLASWLGCTEEAVMDAMPNWLTVSEDGTITEKGISTPPPPKSGSGQYDIKIPR